MPKKKFIIALTFILVFSCLKKSEGLKQTDVPILISQFLAMHAQYHQLDDTLSERTLANYITMLDYGKYYFYKKDYNDFQKYKDTIDDMIQDNQFMTVINDIYGRYKKRFRENMKIVNELMAQNYNFNEDEKMIVDSDKLEYAADRKEMKERWRKNVKLQLLNYLSAGKDMKDAKSKLTKKFALMQKRVDDMTQEEILSEFINAFTTALDPHSNYLTQDEHEDFKISMELKLEGIGVRLRSEDGFVLVESIIPGGASDKLPEGLKLKPGDKIVSVAQSDGEITDVIDMDLRDVVKKIRGKQGTEVRLTVIRERDDGNSQRLIVPIIREEIKLQDSDAKSDIYLYNQGGTTEKIGYIKLPSFYYDAERQKSSATDVKLQLAKLMEEGVKGIILDLRDNPGGLLNEAIAIAGLFIDNGPVVQIKDGKNPPHVINDDEDGAFYSGPLVVLINKFSASASEILAGAIKDYHRGLVVGPTNTFGKGTVQSYNPLPSKRGAIKVTTHVFYQPGGTSNQLMGIAPDVIVPALSAVWDIGEDKTKFPLTWKKIASASYKPYGFVNQQIVALISAKSASRVSTNQKYQELVAKIRKYKEQMKEKTISLKEESAMEKQREKELEKALNRDDKRKIMDPENDIFLHEAFNVTHDYLQVVPAK